MHIHIALYRWLDGTTDEQVTQSLRIIETLAHKIPGIVEISCAENTSGYAEGYTHVILVRAKTQAAIDAYRAHPDHVRAAVQIEAMEAKGIGVDFVTKK